jgi:hypothetical protein
MQRTAENGQPLSARYRRAWHARPQASADIRVSDMTAEQKRLCVAAARELDSHECESVRDAPSYRELVGPFEEAIYAARARKTKDGMPDLGPRKKTKRSSDPVLEDDVTDDDDVVDREREEDDEDDDDDETDERAKERDDDDED